MATFRTLDHQFCEIVRGHSMHIFDIGMVGINNNRSNLIWKPRNLIEKQNYLRHARADVGDFYIQYTPWNLLFYVFLQARKYTITLIQNNS